MDKYYTPELEEFHPGFQFQYLKQTGEWADHIFCESEFDNPELDQYEDYLMKWAHAISRVKYLDREDFMSEGHTGIFERGDQLFSQGIIVYRGADASLDLVYNETSHWLLISIDGKVIHAGICKNVSEFRKLKKSLRIDETFWNKRMSIERHPDQTIT